MRAFSRTCDPVTLCPTFGVIQTELDDEVIKGVIDELVAVGTAEGFDHFDGLIDDDGVGCFGHSARFMTGHQQNGALYGAEVFFVTIEQWADLLYVGGGVVDGADDQFVGESFIRLTEFGHLVSVFGGFGDGNVVDDGLVQSSYGKLLYAAAGCLHGFSSSLRYSNGLAVLADGGAVWRSVRVAIRLLH